MGKHRVKFYEVLHDLLEKRLDLVRQGITPNFTDVRHLFYESRNVLLRTTDLNEIDSRAKNPYSDFSGHIGMFCMEHCTEFGIDVDRYWLLRDKMNIYAAGKATCQGQVPKYLVDYTNRDRMSKGCSFILVCEKATVSMELLSALQKKGYKVNLVSTGGMSTNDTKEAIIQSVEGLDEENFFILVLHDYDLAGVEILFNLHKYHGKLMDVGVNKIFIDFLKSRGEIDQRLVEERVTNRKYMQSVQDFIENNNMDSAYNFNYLQGEQVSPKEWIGHRIEIDAIHVQYGIQPFVDYIVDRLLDISCWDLRRIGINKQSLYEPDNLYFGYAEERTDSVRDEWLSVENRIDEPVENIHSVISDALRGYDSEITRLRNLHWVKSEYHGKYGKLKDMSKLLAHYSSCIEKLWSSMDEFVERLEELNDQIPCYEGDVTEAEGDIRQKMWKIQEDIRDAKRNDEALKEFVEQIEKVEYGFEELQRIEIPDEIELTKEVIEALQEHLDELEWCKNEQT